ncbi:SusC/RagA family TonB-linked outer membrane protein [Flavivirga rizhaonensis]|uniref:SusC/RagA family TonB-linked outer membrane protein n=1 Tax=Flavivirga rizhaonensis TaxID=2559571 RepID=A0A4S1DW43_9FLAO|nr:SusC/RagA family TonB-linked outer membrane protein [Flavivirga rizhaonensis]TGV02123.1 SusC/RagA family TonB-linked outer membrane protein [Flavivirga rizhaonensis]
MTKTNLLLFVFLCFANVRGYSQNQKFSLDFKNKTIINVFDHIENISNYKFLYSSEYFDFNKKISVKVNQAKIEDILNNIFKSTDNIEYEIVKNQIIIREKEIKKNTSIPSDSSTKNQKVKISGSVKDDTAAPFPGVLILIKDTNRGATTDFDGSYSIAANVGDTIVFTYLGFKPVEVLIDDRTRYDIKMEPSSLQLDEVEIYSTGYQEIPRERSTGSFENISESTLKAKVTQNVFEQLEGEVSGLVLDADGRFIIRGLSTINGVRAPLYVVDGFPLFGGIEFLNPNDVKSITVLKDAAAASIWGIRASNGVIIITTKKGERNKKLNISMLANTGFSPKQDLSAMRLGSPQTQIDFNQAQFNAGLFSTNDLFNPNQIATSPLNSGGSLQLSPVVETLLQRQNFNITEDVALARLRRFARTDLRQEFKDRLLRPKTISTFNLGVSGGGENHDFRASIAYNNNNETTVNAGDRTFQINLSNTYDISSKLTVRSSFNMYQVSAFDNAQIIEPSDFFNSYPIVSRILDDDGNYVPQVGGRNVQFSNFAQNQGFLYPWTFNIKQEIDNTATENERIELRLSTAVDYKLLEGFNATLSYQYQQSRTNQESILNENTFAVRNAINSYTQLDENGFANSFPIPEGSIYRSGSGISKANLFRAQLNYNKNFNDGLHRIAAITGWEARTELSKFNNNTLYGFDAQTLDYTPVNFEDQFFSPFQNSTDPNALGARSIPRPSSVGEIENRFLSYYANASYTYKNRYVLSGSTRLDDTNLFGTTDEFRNIPLYSLGLSWDITRDFFEKNNTVNFLKLRVTYGTNGNTGPSSLSPLLQADASSRDNGPFRGLDRLTILSFPNPSLRLEKTKTFNLGVDYSLFDYKLRGSIEYYSKQSENLLVRQLLNATLGVDEAILNVGELRNQGIDTSLRFNPIKTEDFMWSSTSNFSINTNEITRVNNNSSTITSTRIFGSAIIKGEALQTIYSTRYAGLDSQGAPQFTDNDGNILDVTQAITDVNYLQKEDTTIPRYYGSVINQFSYKNLSLRILSTFKAGHVFRYRFGTYLPSYIPGFQQFNVQEDFGNRWQQPGDENSTDVPAFVPSNDFRGLSGYQNLADSNRFVDTAAHIRLRQINLGFSMPQSTADKIGLTSFRIALQADNLAVWSFNKWNVDPENGFFPLPTTYTLNINIAL